MAEHDDAVLRPRTAVAQFQHFRLHPQGVAGEHGTGEAHLVPPEIAHGGAVRGVAHRYADHEAEGERAIDQGTAELGGLGVFRIQMDRGGIHGQARKEHVVSLGDRTPHVMPKALSDLELLKVQPCHRRLLGAAPRGCRPARPWTSWPIALK
ncbi:hypothetical protein D9M68_907940 [compost metagenome]